MPNSRKMTDNDKVRIKAAREQRKRIDALLQRLDPQSGLPFLTWIEFYEEEAEAEEVQANQRV